MKREKGVIKIKYQYQVIVTDPIKGVVQDTGIKDANSLVTIFLAMLYHGFKNNEGGGAYPSLAAGTLKTVGNTDRTSYFDTHVAGNNLFQCNAGTNDDSFGCVLGTSNTAVAKNQYKLETQITNSTFQHLAQGSSGLSGTGSDTVLTLQRVFISLSASPVTIQEIGLYVKSVNSDIFMIARDIATGISPITLSQAVTVKNIFTITT